MCMAALALVLSTSHVQVHAADACQRYRAELANLKHSVRSVAGEIADLTRYKQDMGCLNATGFFDSKPPACAAVDARIQTILQSPDSVGYDNRDKQQRLRVLIHKTCDEVPRPQETNAGDGGDDGKNVPKASGGSKLICVRMWRTGAYAPIERSVANYAGADELCKASCPGNESGGLFHAAWRRRLERCCVGQKQERLHGPCRTPFLFPNVAAGRLYVRGRERAVVDIAAKGRGPAAEAQGPT